MNKVFLIQKKLQVLTPLKLKTAVLVATLNDLIVGKATDFPMKYIHGVKIYDSPYKELYFVGDKQYITEADEVLLNDTFAWVERKKLVTLQDLRKIQRDKKEFRAIAKRNALLAEIDTLKPKKRED